MIKLKLTALLLIFFSASSFCQLQNDSLSILKKNLESFNFQEVIKLSNQLLSKKDSLEQNEIKEIYRMKAVSHFSINQFDSSKNSFIEILKIDSTFNMDSSKISPKIISFFKEIKNDYMNIVTQKPAESTVKIDTIYVPQYIRDFELEDDIRNSLARSLIFPGWGHFYQGYTAKGWIFSSLTLAALSSTIYFIIDSNKKEKEYLEQSEREEILQKYHDYNLSFWRRNISIASLAAVWLYAQIDLLFISNGNETGINTVYIPKLDYSPRTGIHLSYRINF